MRTPSPPAAIVPSLEEAAHFEHGAFERRRSTIQDPVQRSCVDADLVAEFRVRQVFLQPKLVDLLDKQLGAHIAYADH
jgi:hypothetical protein